MSREHKYQAWQPYAKEMFEVIGLQWSAATSQKFSKMELLSMDGNYTTHTVTGAVCDNFILREFTGLKDKNGRDIYEGDIIQWQVGNYKTQPDIVEWHEGICGFSPFCDYDRDCDGYPTVKDHEYYAIIGNIWENPELAS